MWSMRRIFFWFMHVRYDTIRSMNWPEVINFTLNIFSIKGFHVNLLSSLLSVFVFFLALDEQSVILFGCAFATETFFELSSNVTWKISCAYLQLKDYFEFFLFESFQTFWRYVLLWRISLDYLFTVRTSISRTFARLLVI